MTDFTLKQLRYFVAAAESGSIRGASEAVGISQATISAAISQLESHMAMQLFVRHHAQGLTLTSSGIRLFEDARLFLRQAEQLGRLAQRISGTVSGPLGIGCLAPLAPFVVPALCHAFSATHEQVTLNIQETHQDAILNLLRCAQLDIALTYDLSLSDDLHFEPLASLPPYVVLAKSHHLAGRGSLTLEELAKEQLILIDLPLSREYFLALFEHRNLTPNVYSRTTQSDVMRGLVGLGHGYGLANVRPVSTVSLDGSELVYIPLEGSHRALVMGLLTLPTYIPGPATEAFAGFVRERLADGMLPGMTASVAALPARNHNPSGH